MKLDWIAEFTLGSTMTLVMTGCALFTQPQNGSQPIEKNNTRGTIHVSTLTPFTTEVPFKTEQDSPLQLPANLMVEEYTLMDRPMIEPLTFHPVFGTQEDILARRHDDRLKTYPDNSFFDGKDYAMRTYLGPDELVARQQYNETGSEGWVAVTRNGTEIYRISTSPAGPLPIAALRGLWAYDDHWVLETAKIVTCQDCSLIIKEALSQISQDGALLNDQYGYKEMFGFQLMADAPFYFLKQNDKINFSFDGQVVSVGYYEIPHFGCCSSGSLNPVSAENMVAFFAKRGDVWYYVEIGVYKDGNQAKTPSPESQPCLAIPDINQPDEAIRAFLDEVSECDLKQAKHFWIEEVWDGGIDQLVTSWVNSEHDFIVGETTYEGFFAPSDYRAMEADDPRVSGALVSATIDGEQGSFALEKTCETWLISGWIVTDKIKE